MMMIIAPHPDDDILCCGNLIYKNNKAVKIIFVTDGSKGSPRPEEHGRKLALKRVTEAYNALRRLGVKDDNVVFLNNEDGNVKRQRERVYRQLSDLILGENNIRAIYFPSPFDAHPDHSEIGKIILSIVHDYKLKDLDLFMFTIHKINISRILNFSSVLTTLWELKIRLTWKYVCFDVENAELKKQALEEHKSQISYMNEKVKKLVLSNSECFYFKRI